MRLRLLSAAVLLSLLVVSLTSRGGTAEPSPVPDALHAQAAAQGTVRVIVRLSAPFVPEGQLASPAHVMGQRQMLAGVQATVRGHLRSVHHRVVRDFSGTLPLMALEASPDALRMLASLRGIVADVQEDQLSAPGLVDSIPLINANDVWAAGYNGSDQIVAILDTGVQNSHTFFGGRVIAEACFSSNSASSTTVCPGNVETSFAPGSGVNCPVAGSGCKHGTHVAGIAAGSSVSFSGVARGASIIAIQVFSRFPSEAQCGVGLAPCVLSFSSDQLEALNYVNAQRQIFPGRRIAAVNMSLGGNPQNFSTCPGDFRALAIDQLRTPHPSDPTDPGVATVISSGNNGWTSSISTPACNPSAIPVASSTKSDAISGFSNMASPATFPNLLVAPGSLINSSVPPSTFAIFSGTSMSAPHVAGTFAVLREVAPTATVDQILTALKNTGTPITDTRVAGGFTAPRIDVLAAALQLSEPNLVVQTLTAPAVTVPGSNISISTSIRNTGIDPVVASNLQLYLSTDNVITTADTPVSNVIAFNALGGGGASPATTLGVQIPPATAPGTYYIGAIADVDEQVTEGNENDNTRAVQIQIVLPDLTVPSVTFTPALAGPGMNMTVTHTVRNVAAGPANAPPSTSGIYLGLDQSFGSAIGGPLALVSVPAVAAGAASPLITTTNVNIPGGTALGRYYVLVRANDTSGFAEGTTANNVGASATTILLGPDLTVTAASTATGVSPGGNASVTYTIKNQGGQAAGAFDVGFALVPQPSGTNRPIGPSRNVASLAVGAMTAYTNVLSIPQDTPPGAYKIQVTIDAGVAVSEADESNNTFLTGVVNVAQADLSVQTVTFAPLATLPGGNVTVTHVVKNVAPVPGAASGSFSRLFLSPDQTVGSAVADFGLVGVPPIAAGAMATVGKGVSIPGNTSVGLYYILASTDDPGTIFEPNAANNLAASLTRLIVGPDVLPTAASTVTGAAPGMNVSVMYTLKNRGGQATNLDVVFSLELQPGGAPIAIGPGRAISGFAAGATTAYTNVVTVPANTAPGPYRIRVLANPVSDADSSNNSLLTGVVNVVRADLSVPSVTFLPAASFPGGNVTVMHTVKNLSLPPGSAAGTSTRLLLAQNQSVSGAVADFGLVSVPAIAPGAMVTVPKGVQIPIGLAPGLYYFLASADDPGAILEFNDANNLGFSPTRIIVGPDVLPTAATTPAATAPGMNLSVNYTLKNQGGAATGPFDVGLAIVPVNASGTPIGADAAIGVNQSVPTILPGLSVMRTAAVTIPTLASGLHRIRVIVDPANTLVEADDSNNTRLTAGTLNVVRPDLVVPPFTATPAANVPGGAFTVTYAVKNQAIAPGNAGSSSSRLFLSLNQSVSGEVATFGTVGVPPIAAGVTVSGTRVGSLPGSLAPGLYYFGTEADPGGIVTESNEGNNIGFTQIRIIVGADLVPTVATATPVAIAPGLNVSVANTIKNQGGAATGPFDVGFYLSTSNVFDGGDVLLTTRSVLNLAPGAVSTATTPVTVPSNLSAGTYFLIVRADSAGTPGAVIEANEDNNTKATAAISVVRPDLTVLSVTAPAVTAPGANVSVSHVVKNLAPAAGGAPGTTSRLYLSTDATLDVGTDAELVDVVVGVLAGGAMATLPKTVAIPGGTTPGRYWIIAQANATNTVREADSPAQANNWKATATPIIVGPDLVVTAATGPTLSGPGVPFPATTTIKNQGGQAAGPSVVTFHLAQTGQPDVLLSANRSVPMLAPGAMSGPIATTVTIPTNTSAGTYFIKVQTDGLSDVGEADETNNFRSTAAVNIQATNLKIMSIATPAAVIRGRVTGAPSASVVVKNIGLGPSAPFAVQVFANRDDGTADSQIPGSGDLLFTRNVAALAPGAMTTITGPIVIPEGILPAVRLSGNYWVSALADPAGAATGDPSLGDNGLTLVSKPLPVLPDMTKLHSATVALTLQAACGIPDNGLDLQGPVNFTSQSVANPSTFSGTVTLSDPSEGFNVAYGVTGTVRAVDSGGTPGAIASTFTYSGGGTSGTGTISGAAAGLDFTGGVINGQQSGFPACNFTGSIDIVR